MPVTLPYDVLNQIIGDVDHFSDVLNFALSNKALYSVAVPHHLHYRDIRSRLHNPALWSWLSRLDDLHAANIRSLTILTDDNFIINDMSVLHIYIYRERFPVGLAEGRPEDQRNQKLTPETCRESEKRLILALQRMSGLQQFRWYRLPRPILQGADDIWSTLNKLGSVKEVDIFDEALRQDWHSDFPVTPIALSDTFLCFRGFTSFTLATSICSFTNDLDISQLEQMLLGNCPDLEVLILELVHDFYEDYTANIDRLLKIALWPNLRVLHLQGVHCRVPELTRFLIAHPSLEELGLAQTMPGHACGRLELPSNALPNLRRLKCSSSQAAALLKNTSICLETLLGIDVHSTVIDSHFIRWDNDLENEGHDDRDPNMVHLSPWRALFLDCLKAQNSITCLEVASIHVIQEMEVLSLVAPQIQELRIFPQPDTNSIPETEWIQVYSLFPALQVIRDSRVISFGPHWDHTAWVSKTNINIQSVAQSCPRLRLVSAGEWIGALRKAVIIRSGEAHIGVQWVVRQWEATEDQHVKDGENVYGSSNLDTLQSWLINLMEKWNIFSTFTLR